MTRVVACVIALSLAAPAWAGVGDVAELFPADTLAYAEVARPDALADALAALTRGTPLADPLKFTHDRLDKVANPPDAAGVRQAGLLALLASPELLAEVRRFRGAAVGLTGFTPQHQPRLAAAILLGDSPAAGLAVRAFLTAGPNVRRVGAVDGVPVFQHSALVGPLTGADGKPVPPGENDLGPPPTAAGEPTYAYTPGLFVVGSDREAVAGALRRFAGKGDGKSLAADPEFRRARAAADGPGVWLFARPAALLDRLDAANKATGHRVDPDLLALLRFTLNLKAVRTASARLTVRPDAVVLTVTADLDVAIPCPLALTLTGPPPGDPLRFTAGAPVWAVTVSLPVAGSRLDAVLTLADAVSRAIGRLGPPPSAVVAEVDRGPGPRIGADLLAGVNAVTLFAPARLELPAGAAAWPVVVLHLDSPEAAARWDAGGVKLLSLLAAAEKPPTVSSELIGDVRVFTVPAAGLPGGTPWHFARGRQVVAFGQDRKVVAEAVAGRAAARPHTPGPVGVGYFAPGRVLERLVPHRTPRPAPAEEGAPLAPEPPAAGLAQSLHSLAAVPLALTRTPSGLRVEARLDDPAKPLAAAAERFLDWLARQPPDGPQPRPGFNQFDR